MDHFKNWVRWSRIALLALLVCALGCRQKDQQAEDPNKKPKERIEATAVRTLPASSVLQRSYAKPGYWSQTRQNIVANAADESLVLKYSPIAGSTSGSRNETPIDFYRSSSIAKGQSKNIEQAIYFPQSVGQVSEDMQGFRNNARVQVQITDRRLGSTLGVQSESIGMLDDYQSLLVILAKNPDTQSYWQRTNLVTWPRGINVSADVQPFRCILINATEIRENFPSNLQGLASTSTIYWNDVSAEDLSEEQQQAILDWLHYGGRLIVNGPSTIAGLANSFLSPYLPLVDLKSNKDELDECVKRLDAFSLSHSLQEYSIDQTSNLYDGGMIGPISEVERDVLNNSQSDNPNEPSGKSTAELSQEGAIKKDRTERITAGSLESSLCTATLTPNSTWVPECEGLLAETKVGSGRVCMSTFDLSNQMVTNWESYGSFLHSAVFRLPRRIWSDSINHQSYLFDDDASGKERTLAIYSQVGRVANSNLRSVSTSANRAEPSLDNQDTTPSDSTSDKDLKPTSMALAGAGWSGTQSFFGILAVSSLQSLSGIKVPPIDYLTKILGVYLLVLVPTNWIVFRLLRRVEWAWFAIPLIAIGGAVAVARLLQVEIGFARSQNCIGLLELQNGYSRGPLSRYLSLYTSLSSRFSLSYESSQGYVLPLESGVPTSQKFRNIEYSLFDNEGSGIRSLPVRSHTSALFQSDEMVDLKGALQVWQDQADRFLKNATALQLQDIVWARNEGGQVTLYWVGTLLPGQQVSLKDLTPVQADAIQDALQKSMNELLSEGDVDPDSEEARRFDSKQLVLSQMMLKLLSISENRSQDDVVISWTKNLVSELEIQPQPTQREDVTIVCMTVPSVGFGRIDRDRELPPKDLLSGLELMMEDPEGGFVP